MTFLNPAALAEHAGMLWRYLFIIHGARKICVCCLSDTIGSVGEYLRRCIFWQGPYAVPAHFWYECLKQLMSNCNTFRYRTSVLDSPRGIQRN